MKNETIKNGLKVLLYVGCNECLINTKHKNTMDINKFKNELLKFHIISEIQCPIFFDEKLFLLE